MHKKKRRLGTGSLPLKKALPRDHVAEATRPVYLIASTVEVALTRLLKSKNRAEKLEALSTLEECAKYLKINVTLLRKEVERAPK